MEAAILPTDTGVLVRLRVQPRAKADRLEGLQNGRLRLRVTAPPVNGAANAACIAWLARTLGVRRAQISMRAGSKSRDKLVQIDGVTLDRVAAAFGIPVS